MQDSLLKNNNPLVISQEDVEQYLTGVSERSRGHYRYSLLMFYSWLPADKTIHAGIMGQWRDHLQEEGYAESTINARISACNNLMDYMGRRDLQVTRLKSMESNQPELTRSEYLRLLEAANVLGRDTEYMMIQLFAAGGLSMESVQNLTMEDVPDLTMPDFMKEELTAYGRRRGRETGLLFSTRSGKPIDRAAIRSRINRLARAARVDAEKANPRCLQRLYRSTMEGIRNDVEVLVQRNYHEMLAGEYRKVTWPKSRSSDKTQ